MIFYCLIIFTIFADVYGSDCGDLSLVQYEGGQPLNLPWSVKIKVKNPNGEMYCDGVIVSPTQIITWECDHYGSTPVSLFMNRKKVVEDFLFGVIQFPSRRISKPNWRRLNNDYEILTLDKPIKSSKKHAPICVDGAIRREYLPSLIYFNWKQKYHLDGERAIMAVVHYQQISRDALYPTSALSYMKDGKFHFAGIISMNKNSKVEKYVPFEGSTLREMVTAN